MTARSGEETQANLNALAGELAVGALQSEPPTTAPKGPPRMWTEEDRDHEARIQALIDQEQDDDSHEPGCASQSYPDPGICYCEDKAQ